MDATCKIQDSILVFSLVRKYVSRILGTYHLSDMTVQTFLNSKFETKFKKHLTSAIFLMFLKKNKKTYCICIILPVYYHLL